jgi:hypothetical protein
MREIPNRYSNDVPQTFTKQQKHKSGRLKEIIKIEAEINETENKGTIQRINETKKLVHWQDKQN